MKQEIFRSRKTIFFLLFISIFVLQANLVWAIEGFEWMDTPLTDEDKQWRDAGFITKYEIYDTEGFGWKDMGFAPNEAKRWKLGGYSAVTATEFKALLFSTPDEVKQFTKKYCKEGFARYTSGAFASPPANYNDAIALGEVCYTLDGRVFQLLGDSEALYEHQGDMYYISLGKGGRAVSSISAIVTVKGSYKYQSLAGIKIVPSLKIVKMGKQ